MLSLSLVYIPSPSLLIKFALWLPKRTLSLQSFTSSTGCACRQVYFLFLAHPDFHMGIPNHRLQAWGLHSSPLFSSAKNDSDVHPRVRTIVRELSVWTKWRSPQTCVLDPGCTLELPRELWKCTNTQALAPLQKNFFKLVLIRALAPLVF